MPLIEDRIKDQIRAAGAPHIADLVRNDGAKIKNPSHRKPSCTCVFHDDKTASAQIYPDSGGYHCFTCQTHCKDVFDYLMKKRGLTFPEALKFVADRTGLSHLLPKP